MAINTLNFDQSFTIAGKKPASKLEKASVLTSKCTMHQAM
jgi:hypothetical protein